MREVRKGNFGVLKVGKTYLLRNLIDPIDPNVGCDAVDQSLLFTLTHYDIQRPHCNTS